MKKNFFICGLTGWCLEILYTSLGCFRKKDYRLTGRTSVWMFPIYGMAALIAPVYQKIKGVPRLFRGLLYSAAIFVCEYVSGSILKRHNMCPWDYSDAKYNINGLIRLDFAPLWFATGLLYESILCKDNRPPKHQ